MSVYIMQILTLSASMMAGSTLFTRLDEELVQHLRSNHDTNSTLVLILKHRLATADKAWIHAFCEMRGVGMLIAHMDSRREFVPLSDVDAAALLELR